MCTSKYSSVSPVRYCFKQTRLNRTYGFTITSICQLSCSNKYLKSLPIDLHFDLVNNTENNYQLKTCCKMLNTKNSFLKIICLNLKQPKHLEGIAVELFAKLKETWTSEF